MKGKHQGGVIMRIYPINQSPIMFRGNSNNVQHSHSTMKRYCEPRTGVYYYYDSFESEKNNKKQGFSNFINNISEKFHNLSKEISNTFALNNVDNDESNWL